MKVLFVGEIVSDLGKEALKEVLPEVLEKNNPDLVLANIENISGGRGVLLEDLKEMQNLGIDYFTTGDHVFFHKNIGDFIDRVPLIRPANYPLGTIGKGYDVITGDFGRVLLINLMGTTSFGKKDSLFDNPFKKIDEILGEYRNEKFDAIIIDFHAEATSEKNALGFYLDGKVTAVIGTHTHVPTADTRILPLGTMFVTDVGMCGSIDSVLGVKKEIVIDMFVSEERQKFEWESTGTKGFRSVLFDTESKSITRIDRTI